MLLPCSPSRTVSFLCVLLPMVSACLLQAETPPSSAASIAHLPTVVVEGGKSDDLIGPYQQPRWSARGRFSADTDVYVLPPFEAFVDIDYEMTLPKHGSPIHLFTQEVELGLPHRFQIAYENAFEFRRGREQETQHTFEGRWALADWGEIPLNPTFFVEYKFGVGKRPMEEASDRAEAEDEEEHEGAGEAAHGNPDAYELRLLLGEQLGEKTQWALNLFREQQLGGDREVELGFSQAISYAICNEKLRVGAEMQFIRETEKDSRSHGTYEFDIGPSLSYKPSPRTRFDVAALFGTTKDSPDVKLFAVFSISLGSDSEQEIAAPVSTQNR